MSVSVLEVTSLHATPVVPLNGSVTLSTVSGDTIYYGQDQTVSASNNTGSLTSGGGSVTLTVQSWVTSAGVSAMKMVSGTPSQDVVVGSDGLIGGAGGTGLTAAVVLAGPISTSAYGLAHGHYALDAQDNLAIGSTLPNLAGGSHANVAYGGGTRNGLAATYNGNLNGITTGYDNTAIGAGALVSSVGAAHSNTAVGPDVLSALTTGVNNTAVGAQAGENQTTVDGSVAIGSAALATNVTGAHNVAVGFSALNQTTVGGNTAVGYNAGAALSTGANNTAVGYQALILGTTAAGEVAVGQGALLNDLTGQSNTAIGQNALSALTSGAQNCALGNAVLNAVTTGNANTALGYSAGQGIITGSGVTAIGLKAGQSDGTTATTDVSNATLIGEKAQSQLSNVIVLGKAITTRPNLCFGGLPSGSGFFGNGVGVAFLANAVTAPNANPTAGGILYVTGGALTYRGSSGTVTTVAVA